MVFSRDAIAGACGLLVTEADSNGASCEEKMKRDRKNKHRPTVHKQRKTAYSRYTYLNAIAKTEVP